MVVLLIGGITGLIGRADQIPGYREGSGDFSAARMIMQAADSPAEKSYEELPVDESLKQFAPQVTQMLIAGRFAPGEQQIFDDYYQNFWLPRWTHLEYLAANPTGKEKIPGLPGWRKELRSSHLGKKSNSTEVHDHLNALLLDFMGKLAAGNHYPTTQVNAMLMIGELNSVEPSGIKAATPLPDALKALVAAVENPQFSDAIHAAAMVGVLRHADLGIQDENARKSVAAAMLTLTDEAPPTGAAAQGRAWILAQAVNVLGSLHAVGQDAVVFKAILKTASQSKLPFNIRTAAVASLGQLDYSGNPGIAPVDAAVALGQFAIDACDDELRLMKITQTPNLVLRRRLKQRLDAVLTALNGTGGKFWESCRSRKNNRRTWMN